MKVLVLGFGNASGRYNPPSTHCENYISRNMGGHEIVTFGYNEGVDIIIKPEDEFEKLLGLLPEGWQPDLCLLWLLEWNLLPRGIERAPFPTCACIFDWDYDVPYSRTCMATVDLTVVTGDFDRETVAFIDANHAETFFFAGAMKMFFNHHPKKIRDRKIDILYTTWIDESVQPGRSDWISKLCSLSDRYKVHIDSHLNYGEYLAFLNESKLVLSYNRHGAMAVRVTDAGTQGSVVLDGGRETQKYFTPGEDYIPVTDDNFADQIEHYLNDENALQRISDSFHKKVTEKFDSGNRFEDLLKFCRQKLNDSENERAFNALNESEQCLRRGEIYYYANFTGAPGVFFLYAGSHMLELSIAEFKKAVALDATPRGMTNLAVATAAYEFAFRNHKIMDEKGENIVSMLEEVLSAWPDYAMAYFNLGVLHFRTGNLTEAREIFIKAGKLFEDKNCDIDIWCLQNRDFDLFNQLLRRKVNANTIAFCKGDKEKAMSNIRDIYRTVMLYFTSLMEDESGHIHKSMDLLVEAYNASPDCGPVVKQLTRKLALMGFADESLKMYKESIRLFPVDMSMRMEYIPLLYLYKKDKEVINILRETLKITQTVVPLRINANELKYRIMNFARFNSEHYQMYDSTVEVMLSSWVEGLFDYLRKDPQNLNLLIRIADIWNALGRTDKIIELLTDYCSNSIDSTDREGLAWIHDTEAYLREKVNSEYREYERNIDELEKGLSTGR